MLNLPGTQYSWFGKMGKKCLSASIIWCLLCSIVPANTWAQVVPPRVQTVDVVAILIDDDLATQASIKTRVNRYAADVQTALEAQAVIIPITDEATPIEIHELLAQYYYTGFNNDGLSQLKGVVLVGDIPLPVVAKGGNNWPTVFPYVDFDNPSYRWDYDAEQFVFEDNYLMTPEIWHGVIRSNKEKLTDQVDELELFFDKNHKTHQAETNYSQKVFYANFERQKKVIPAESFFRYQEWVRYAEPIQYLRFTKHFARELLENQKSAGISAGVFSELDDDEKQKLATEITATDSNVSREDVLESLNTDTLAIMPDIQSKQLIDNFAQRYFEIYTHWITEVNERVGMSARWEPEMIDTTPALVSRKDEASILKLRYFNDLSEELLLDAFEEYNIAENLFINHEVPVIYTEGSGEDAYQTWDYFPHFWNGVDPKNGFTAENCSLIRGSQRAVQTDPLAQQVEANRTLDIRTADSCKNVSEPGYASDIQGGCCAKNIKYEDNEFGYEGCITTSNWIGSPNATKSQLYHSGARLPVLGLAGTRELAGAQGAAGCLPALNFNENEAHSTKFSTLMIHDEPRPETIMEQVESQFTRALPVDDPRGFSFLDHGREFRRLPFPNVFEFREQVESYDEFEQAVRDSVKETIKRVNLITQSGNAASEARRESEKNIYAWPPPPDAPPVPAVQVEGAQMDCQIGNAIEAIDEFMSVRIWTRNCEEYSESQVTSPTGGITTTRESHNTYTDVIKRHYDTGKAIPESIVDDFLADLDLESIYEALTWIDKNIEEKNRAVFEVAMSDKPTFQDFFADTESDGYEVIEILGEGSHENGLELAFSPLQIKPDREFEDGLDDDDDELGVDVDSLCEGIPSRPELDMEYLKAKEKFVEFQFKDGKTKNMFMGQDMASTFLGSEEESKCDQIPSTMLYWPSKIACSAKATASGASKKLFLGENLGTTKPLEPIIESFDVDLKNKRIVVEPRDIMIHAQSVDPVEVRVKVVDAQGAVQIQDFSTEIALNFDSQEASRLFEIAPDQSIPVTKGEAIFFLMPKTSQFGGRVQMTANASREDSDLEVESEPTNILVSRYGGFGVADKTEIVVKDPDGVKVRAKVLNQDNELTYDLDGEVFEFRTDAGTFLGGETSVEIKEGQAVATFLPGTKAQKAQIELIDPTGKIAPGTVDIELLPDDPATVYVSKKSSYLIKAAASIPITAKLLDQYGNTVFDVFHKWSWQWEDLEVEASAERDTDPRIEGIQEFTNYSGESTLLVSAKPGTSQARLTVGSDYFEDGKGRTLNLVVIEDPVFEIALDKKEVIAGGDEAITASVKALTREGELINDDFKVSLVVSPVEDGFYPDMVNFVDGEAQFEFTPGTLAGNFTLRLQSPGYVPGKATFKVLPGEPEKLEISRLGNTRYAAELDEGQPIEIELKALDAYRNVVPTFSSKIDFRATEVTSYLVDIPEESKTITRGQTTVDILPKGLSGKVRLIADHEDLTGDAMELELADYFRISDVRTLAPKSYMAMIFGFEAGDQRDQENFANAFLHTGNTQSVATLTVPPLPAYQYGRLARDGRLGNALEPTLVEGNQLDFLIESDGDILTQVRTTFEDVGTYLGTPNQEEPGIYLEVQAGVEDITLTDSVFYKGVSPILETNLNGGLSLLSSTAELEATDNLLKWELLYQGDPVGMLTIVTGGDSLEVVEAFTETPSPGLEMRAIHTDVYFDRVFVDADTNGDQGYGIFDQAKTEERSRRLGGDFPSVESLLVNNDLGWSEDWKAGTIFGALNSIGISHQWGSSDALIIYGDPTLKLRGENERKPNGLTQDIGIPLWRSGDGVIRKILGNDINNDGHMDIMNLVENTVYGLYQTDTNRGQFRDVGPIIEFLDGVNSLATINLGNTENPDHKDLLQLNSNGELILWENTDSGVFRSKPLELNLEQGIETFQIARLNTDNYEDLIVTDLHHKMWAVYGQESGFRAPVVIKDLAPEFEKIEESFAYAETDYAPINLKYTMFSYDGIRQNENVSQLDWNRFIRPTAPVSKTISAEELEPLLLNDYYNTGGETLTDEAIFVRTDKALFLSSVELETSADQDKIKPGDRIKVSLEVVANGPLNNFALLPAKEGNSKFLEETFRCLGCTGDVRLFPGAGDGFFWAEVGNISGTVTFTWQEEVTELNVLKYFVGDFDNGFDDLDDLSLPWAQEGKEVLMQFTTQKKPGNKATFTESPYPLNPDILGVSKPKNSLDLVQNLTPEDLRARSAELFGRDSDIDSDGLPYSFDHYNSQNNFDVDRKAALSGNNLNFQNLLKANNQEKRAQMLMGGGSCFNQPESAAPSAPGLINDRAVPHAKPKGKQQGQYELSWLTTKYTSSGPVPSTAPTDTPGDRTEPHPYRSMGRTYTMPTSTGKTGKAICLGSFPVHMAAPNWTPNCFVSTPPVKFMQSCANPQDYEPKKDQLMCAADSYVQGSSTIGTSGFSSGGSNAGMKRGPGKINAPLTGTNATSFQNLMSGQMNNDKTGKGNANASSMTPNPDFASNTRTSPTTAGGKKGQNLNNLMADIVDVTHEPVPVSVPASSPQEIEDAKEDFSENKEALQEATDENIPPVVIDLQSDLEGTIEGLKNLGDLEASEMTLPKAEDLAPLVEDYKRQLGAFRVSIERDVCGKPGKQKTCDGAKKLIREATSSLRAIESLLATDYSEVSDKVETFAAEFEGLKPEVKTFAEELDTYAESLDGPVEARNKIQNHTTRFEQNFENLDQAAGEGAKKILEIRDLENKIVSSTAQMVEQYQNYHQGWMAKNQQREQEWQAQGEANKQILSMVQTVPQIFTDFANNCRTGNVDRATLLPWLTDNVFEKGASRKVINLPTNPNAELDGRQMSPAKMDLKLPTPQINQIAMGPIATMDDQPDVPDYREEIETGVQTFDNKIDVAAEVRNTEDQLAKWNEIYTTLRKTGSFFPTLDSEGNITKKGSSKAILPLVDTQFKPVSVEDVQTLINTEIPELVEEKPLELPFVKTMPAMPGGNQTAFKPDVPSLPMDQMPFLPPPPKMDNLTCGMLNNLKVPLSFLNLECMIRLGVAPVSEWYVKPHVERRTNRSALSKNKDFTSKSIKPGPFTGNPNTMSVFGKTDRTDIFKGNHDQLKSASQSQSQFIKSGSQSPISNPVNSVPSSGKTIKTSSLNPLEEWQSWVAKGESENTRTLDPVTFIKAAKHLSKAMPTYTKAQENLKVKLAKARVPENTQGAKELAEVEQAFDNYLAKLETYRQGRLQETKRLAHILETEGANFFQDQFVQNTLNKDKRFLASNEVESALDFSIPKREFTTSVAQFEPPVEDTADFNFVEEDFVEDLASTQPDSCAAGVEPGIYHGNSGSDSLDRINKLPYRTISAYAVFDLDGDDENEVLYGLGQELFIKRKSEPKGTKQTFNVLSFEAMDLTDIFRPVDRLDRYDFYEALNSEFEKHRSLPKYTEWEFSERPDQIFEIHKTAANQAASFQQSIGLVQQIVPEVSDIRPTTAEVTEVSGSPQIKSPLKIPLVKYSTDACENENIIKPFVESGMVMAIDEPANLQVYFPPNRSRDGRIEYVELDRGEELYLEDADVCLYEGTAWFAQYDYLDEFDFWVTNQEVLASEATDEPKVIKFADGSEILIEGRSEWLEKVQNGTYQNWNPLTKTFLLSSSQIRLKEGETATIVLSTGEKRVLQGPQTYHFQIDELSADSLEFRFPVPEFDQVYSQIRGYKVNKKSYAKPQFFPIIKQAYEE